MAGFESLSSGNSFSPLSIGVTVTSCSKASWISVEVAVPPLTSQMPSESVFLEADMRGWLGGRRTNGHSVGPRSWSEARKESRRMLPRRSAAKGQESTAGREADGIETGSVLMAGALLAQHLPAVPL
jgi:hypothetical protein